MVGILIEVVLSDSAWGDIQGLGPLGVRAALDEALTAADLGEVSGDQRGQGSCSIDVELDDEERLLEAEALIRRVLRGLGIRSGTAIRPCEMVTAPSVEGPLARSSMDSRSLVGPIAARDFELGRAAS